ncbi:hypothetical protein BaRGS_00001178 [Batillaria attramentaria]|uniref:Uncharacterized protein n=1 Tax=Batillaria attramentaria TaxID=370345 RepID=A0ABD0M7S1_9CAEN|nr:hypothetical protein BaRGS_000311 [Batillaria attramentaria]
MPFQIETDKDEDMEHRVDDRQLSVGDITSDEHERTVTSLSFSDADKCVASLPLTGGDGIVVRSYTKTPHYLPLAILTLFINAPFGLPAVLCAYLSRRRRQRGHEEGAARMGKAAFWLSMVGIACSVVIGIFIVVYVFVITPNIITINIPDDDVT